MSELKTHRFTEGNRQEVMNFARDALETYVREGQQMDVGSVNDLLNMRGGVLIQIESVTGMNRLRGEGCVYNGQRVAESTIEATVYAASSRSLGSEISYNEADSVQMKIALIEEVLVTSDPVKHMNVEDSIPVIPSKRNGWLFPTQAKEYSWSPEEYLTRTCKTSGLNPNYWRQNDMAILKTSVFKETEPDGSVEGC